MKQAPVLQHTHTGSPRTTTDIHIRRLNGEEYVFKDVPVGEPFVAHKYDTWPFGESSCLFTDLEGVCTYRPYAKQHVEPPAHGNSPHELVAVMHDEDTVAELESVLRFERGDVTDDNEDVTEFLLSKRITNKEVALAIVAAPDVICAGAGHVFELLPSFEEDKEVVIAALEHVSASFALVHPNMRKDKDVAMVAVAMYGPNLEHVHPALQKDKAVVMAAVDEDGDALEYAHPELQKDTDVVMTAVSKNGSALKYAHRDLLQNVEFAMHILRTSDQKHATASVLLDSGLDLDDQVRVLAQQLYRAKRRRQARCSDDDLLSFCNYRYA